MREIKFRAWNADDEEMYPVQSVDFQAATCEVEGDQLTLTWRDEMRTEQEAILMQFTGLKDKNDKPIYEGDIVEFEEPVMESAVLKCPVTFWEGMFVAVWDRSSQVHYFPLNEIKNHDNDIEVIGNIYENPELLK